MKNFIVGLFVIMTLARSASSLVVYTNAKIYDGEQQLPLADTVVVKNGKIIKIGARKDMPGTKHPHKLIDIKGARLMPGFIESHAHLLGIGQSKFNLDFRNKSLKEIIAMLKEQAKKQPEGTWILGRNWDQNQWPGKSFPTAAMLEEVSRTHPIYLRRIDGHAAWVNALALQRAGISSASADPSGGSIVKDASGLPSGVLIDNAMALVSALVDKPGKAVLLRYLERAQEEALSLGITSLHDAGANEETLDLYREQAQELKLKLRIYAMVDGQDQKLVDAYLKEGPQALGNFLTIRSIKYFADGALGSRGALLLEDYSDQKGNRGLALIDEAQLAKKTRTALERGFQVATHAIGDAANRLVLNAYEAALKNYPNHDARLRIEHAQLVHPSDHVRFKKLGIIASMQPIHCTSDMAWAKERLGSERLKGRAYAWKTLRNKGAILAFGSDSPVEPINPILGLYAAVTRQSSEGKPAEDFLPEERLTMKEALSAFYKNAAFAEFTEQKKGRIAEGYEADFVIFDQDILQMNKSAFLNAKPWMTVVGGEIVFKRDR